MQSPRHIVVGTDLSDASRPAIEAAALLAEQFGSQVSLVSVFDPDPYIIADLDPSALDLAPTLLNDVEASVLASLAKVRKDVFAGVETVKTAVLSHRSPGHAITEFCRDEGADLLVVGSHGRTGLRRVLLGSVAEKVVRLAPCDVYVVRAKSD